ncbi:hypothetical protein X805_07590 [Sphaerotilus natans subsp. natans DSM 6575]|uniref:Glycosyltransferase RgtA/B/C/D-like domain-containing protein n=1 Tax=Sphaerotilus natans subsp. natans DSM 6575 TaxID=1286631 RepID=A0A059KQA7_9BURK|nr:glycosyltransferase family 39 protein [Sphaerotilus natans]KDB53677.1 hypothetical protein X805_07590 [Sphaerotilus natans subsp. natans DSM 6575]SIR33492.1 hypothetical protein SAMN05421778_10940 [Sphaerotilus natans]
MSTRLLLRLLGFGALALLLRLALLAGVLDDPTIGLQVDEAQYWGWSRELAWGYYSKPPGIAALIAASTAIGGDGVIGVRWLAMAVQVAAGVALGLLAHDLAQAAWPEQADRARRAAVWATLIALSNPVAGLLGLAATTDAPLLLCWTLAARALWRLRRSGRLADGRGLGLWLGLGLLSKYTMAALLPGLLGWLWRRRHDGGPDPRPALALACALAALLLLPHLLWNAQAGWPTLHHTAEITVQAGPPGARTALAMLGSLAGWLGGQWLMSGPLWLPLWLRWRRRLPAGAALPPAVRELLLALTVPLLLIGAAQALNAKAQINWTAPAMQGLVLALALWLAPAGRRPLRRAAGVVVALHLLLVSTLPLIGGATRWIHGEGAVPPRSLDLWARMRGWEPALQALAPAARDPLAAGAVLIGADRTLISHGRHAWRDLPGADWHAWRPDRRRPPADHYQLVAGWPGTASAADRQRPLLIVSHGETLPPDWLAWLEPPVRLAGSRTAQGAERTLVLTLWRTRLRDTPAPTEPR